MARTTRKQARREAGWLAAFAAIPLAVACALRPPPVQAPPPARAADPGRQTLETYVSQVRDFDVSKTLLAYQLGQQGPSLTPALVAMLPDASDDVARYHLIRLGCVWIRAGYVEPSARPALVGAIREAGRAVPATSRVRGDVNAELRTCLRSVPESTDPGSERGALAAGATAPSPAAGSLP